MFAFIDAASTLFVINPNSVKVEAVLVCLKTANPVRFTSPLFVNPVAAFVKLCTFAAHL